MEYDPEVTFKTEILLTLRNNKITHLGENSFRSFRKLRELDLSYNQVKKDLRKNLNILRLLLFIKGRLKQSAI